MTDANQRWSVNESIEWMKELAYLKPHWIEEPTSPDDVLGHAKIAQVSQSGSKIYIGGSVWLFYHWRLLVPCYQDPRMVV